MYVTAQASEEHVGEVGGKISTAGGTTTRPNDTTPYAVGDLFANNTTAGSVTPIALAVGRAIDKTAMVRKLRLKINDSAWKGATIRVHLFKDSPTVAVGDNGSFNPSSLDTLGVTESNYLGYCDITLSKQFSDGYVKGFGVPNDGSEWSVEPSTGTVNIFALLEVRTATTPAASKVATLVAELYQN